MNKLYCLRMLGQTEDMIDDYENGDPERTAILNNLRQIIYGVREGVFIDEPDSTVNAEETIRYIQKRLKQLEPKAEKI